LRSENDTHKQEIARLNQTIVRERQEYQKTVGDLKTQLDKIDEWFPDVKSLIKMGDYCREIGFTAEMVKRLVGMQPVRFSDRLYSHEFIQRFETTNSEARLEKHDNPFRLFINDTSIIQWFRQKHKEFLRAIGIKVPERKQSVGQRQG
jgi:restriction endonuclease S subunit